MHALSRPILITIFAAAVTSAQQASSLSCDDVTTIDFGNLTIRTAGRVFAFRNGVGTNFDSPQPSNERSQPDWKAEIEKDTVVRPAPKVAVRFILIHDSHETGSGWRYYLTGLRCSRGKLQEVFHRDGLSLSVDRLDSTAITISLNTNPGEATRRRWSYIWNRTASRYELSSMVE